MGAFDPCVQEDEIERAAFVDRLGPLNTNYNSKGKETWSVAFSDKLFAWSAGDRLVSILPWDDVNCRLQRLEAIDDEPLQLAEAVSIIDTNDVVFSMTFVYMAVNKLTLFLTIKRFDLSPSTPVLATGLKQGRICLWNPFTGSLMLQLCDHKDVVSDMKFAPDNSYRFASSSWDGTVKLWDLPDANLDCTLRVDKSRLLGLSWSPDGKFLAAVGELRQVVLWDSHTYEPLRQFTGHFNAVSSCDFSCDGALLITSSHDTRVKLWDMHTGTLVRDLGHLFPLPSMMYCGGANSAYVRKVAVSPDKLRLASVSDDGYLRIWNLMDMQFPESIAIVTDPLCCHFSKDGRAVAVGNRQGEVTIWRVESQLPSLQHLCRLAVRSVLPTNQIMSMALPRPLQDFLAYQLSY